VARSQNKGEAFELRVKALLEEHGFQVERDVLIAGNQIDLLARRSLGPVPEVYIVECKDEAKPIGVNKVNIFIGEVAAARQGKPRARGIFVSSNGFTREAKSTAAATGVTCLTITDLEQGLPIEIDLEPAIARYTQHVVDRYGRLTLYSLKADEPLRVELEKVYVTLMAEEKRSAYARSGLDEAALLDEMREMPIEQLDLSADVFNALKHFGIDSVGDVMGILELGADDLMIIRDFGRKSLDELKRGLQARGFLEYTAVPEYAARHKSSMRILSISEALAESPCLVVVGAPGCGKTTLLQWVALTYARDAAPERLEMDEQRVPVFVPLRALGKWIANHPDRHALTPDCLLSFLESHFAGWKLNLPQGFFARLADEGRCAFLFDGLDEVADPGRRADVTRAVEAFVSRYRDNRYVVTSRPAGHTGLARFGTDFQRCDVRPFSDEDVEQFVTNWYLAVETAAEDNPATRQKAEDNRADLLQRIAENDRIRRLVDTPLLLTVVALVHQNRTTLPQRRAELYDECTQMLLGFWDEQKGGEAARELARLGELDRYEKRAILEPIALKLHEQREAREVEGETLRAWLREEFETVGDPHPEQKARLFLQVIQERAGLLVESEPDTYRFSHLTFQEYLAARAIADRNDYITYTLTRRHDPWWREVVLLEMGHLSTPRSRRARRLTTDLVEAIWRAEEGDLLEQEVERLVRRDLLLAGQCLVDLGPIGVDESVRDGIVAELGELLRTTPYTKLREGAARVLGGLGDGGSAARAAAELVAALPNADSWPVRQAAASSLGQLGQTSPDVVAALIHALADDRLSVRWAAASSLDQLGQASPDVAAALIHALANDRLSVRRAAASSLGQLGQASSDVVAALIHALANDRLSVRRAAASSLGQLRQASPDVVAALIHALANDDSDVRQAAASSLGQLGQASPDVVAALIRPLADDDSWSVRQAAASSLDQLGQASPDVVVALIHTLADDDPYVRQAAASSLSQLGQASPDVVAALIRALADDRLSVCQAAASSLGQLGQASPDIVAALIHALADDDPDVRQAAASSLSQLGQASSDVVAALIHVLADDDSWGVRQAAASSLSQLGQASPDVVAALIHALADSRLSVRQAAASSLGQLGQASPTVVTALIRALANDDSWSVRQAAASSLGQLGQASPDVVAALIHALANDDSDVRQAAASSLGQLGQASPDVVVALIHALADDDLDVCQAAASSLGQLGQASPDVAAALIHALIDDRLSVRRAAASSLGQLGQASPDVVAALFHALADDRLSVRQAAASSLGQLGQANLDIVQTLVDMLEDSDNDVRKVAANSLVRLAADDQKAILRTLLTVFRDLTFETPGGIEHCPAYDYAFDVLWTIAGPTTQETLEP
jgi:HEAT repeat protein